jgi:membrane protein implicated in regulation of membrane protease activity
MNMEADDIVIDRPALATGVVAAVAAVAYVGIQVALGEAVAPLETAVFVVVFTAVYVAGNRYLRRRERADEGDRVDGSDVDADGENPETDGDRPPGE